MSATREMFDSFDLKPEEYSTGSASVHPWQAGCESVLAAEKKKTSLNKAEFKSSE